MHNRLAKGRRMMTGRSDFDETFQFMNARVTPRHDIWLFLLVALIFGALVWWMWL